MNNCEQPQVCEYRFKNIEGDIVEIKEDRKVIHNIEKTLIKITDYIEQNREDNKRRDKRDEEYQKLFENINENITNLNYKMDGVQNRILHIEKQQEVDFSDKNINWVSIGKSVLVKFITGILYAALVSGAVYFVYQNVK